MEKWKPLLEDDDYLVSNYGRVMSKKWTKEKILKQQIYKHYYYIRLRINNKNITKKIHTLVWDYFGDKERDGMKLVVDHKDEKKSNNHIDNLQLLTQKENTHKYHKSRSDTTSKYIGVCFDKQHKKWKAYTFIDGHNKHIGLYETEIEAIKGYELYKNLDK